MEPAVCPIEWRYGTEEMRRIVSREGLIKRMITVETTLVEALAELGIVPREDVRVIRLAGESVRIEEIDALEKRLGHDVMALATAIAERAGDAGRFVHFGATSNDIVDTAWALVLRDSLKLIYRRLKEVVETLSSLAEKYKDTIMPGRTHGQHAIPITLGFKLANYVYEFARSYQRLKDSEKRVLRIKMGGAVGTMAAWGLNGIKVEEIVAKKLGLSPHSISTQVAPRDGFSELVSDLAILASQADRFALEVRELMRPEIDEIREGTGNRVGSSTMPQKENPTTAERIGGIAKVMRGLVVTELENIPLWHERDLTNSSSERIVITHCLLLIDEILESLLSLLKDMEVVEESMMRNLNLTKGLIMSEALMVALTLRGMKRHEAHRLVSEMSRNVRRTGKSLLQVCLESDAVTKLMTEEELREVLNPRNYLGSSHDLIKRTIEFARQVFASERGPI